MPTMVPKVRVRARRVWSFMIEYLIGVARGKEERSQRGNGRTCGWLWLPAVDDGPRFGDCAQVDCAPDRQLSAEPDRWAMAEAEAETGAGGTWAGAGLRLGFGSEATDGSRKGECHTPGSSQLQLQQTQLQSHSNRSVTPPPRAWRRSPHLVINTN